MERSIIARITVISVFAFLIFNFAFADIPKLIQYQGKATEKATGLPLTGNHNITFRLYDSATTGTLQWQEQHLNVPVSNGNFAVLLGSLTTLDLPFDKPYWLSVEINNDGEMSPRERLASVPYAYQAKEATHASLADDLTRDIVEIPKGGIIMWSGNISTIPDGWALCDGANGTPDLRDRFIVGARQDDAGVAKTNVKGTLMQTGGEHEHTLTIGEMPAHSHSCEVFAKNCMAGGSSCWAHYGQASSTGSTGGSQPHENCPPFYALAFIMKL